MGGLIESLSGFLMASLVMLRDIEMQSFAVWRRQRRDITHFEWRWLRLYYLSLNLVHLA
jgi:hypothetical protein